MKPAVGSTVRCTLQACHVYDLGPFHLAAGFACERGAHCPVLHPPPPLPIWRRPWFRRAAVMTLAAAACLAAGMIFHLVEEAKKPRIITLSASANSGPGDHWEAYVKASGEEPLRYQWYQGFRGDVSAPLDHGGNPHYEIPSLTERAVLWVKVENRHGRVESEQLVVEPRIIVQVDYERELFELYRDARALLEQSDSIRIVETQLDEAYVPLEPESRRNFTNVRELADRKQREAAAAFVAKLKFLQTLDRKVVGEKLEKVGELYPGIEGERRSKTLSLMKKYWNAGCLGQAVSEENVIEDAKTFLPL